jgi:hypothetical protein
MVITGVVDPDSLDPDPAFQVNPDPDTGFTDQKVNEKMQLKRIISFLIKNCNLTYP